MSRELLILRHAKSAWNTNAASDFERPLAKRGRRDAPRVGRFLLDQGLIPDYVVSSPAERAKQTVIGVCEQLGIGPRQINWDSRIYGGYAGSLLNVLNDCPGGSRRVLIAGHNPGLEQLVSLLAGGYERFPTAALAQVELDIDHWWDAEHARGTLANLWRPRDLD